jgi:acetyl esterase/lipase
MPLDLRPLGTALTPEMVAGTIGAFAKLHSREVPRGVSITRDVRYGTAERHRLDLFVPEHKVAAQLPVLLFVHGGGFVRGDKRTPDTPFYDNVGLLAARNDLVGATMTYRLAPDHQWPAGSDDVSAAVRWLRENVSQRIFVLGVSAGAAHVSGFIAREHSAGASEWNPAGAILVSGLYDIDSMEKNDFFHAYHGHAWAGRSYLRSFARTRVPLMVVTAELDPVDFLRQGAKLLEALVEERQQYPRFLHLMGHNHLSPVLSLGTEGDYFSSQLLEFIRQSP